MKSFLKFAVLSGGGWLLDCLMLLALTALGTPIGVANFISSGTAALTVFLISRIFVFRTRGNAVMTRALFYVGYQVIGIFIASMVIGPAADLSRHVAGIAGIVLTISTASFLGKVLITPPQLIANYFVSKFLIQHFKRPTSHV